MEATKSNEKEEIVAIEIENRRLRSGKGNKKE
jgi:hypothetical protein